MADRTRRVFEEQHPERRPDTGIWRETVRRRCVEQARELRRTQQTALRGSDIARIVRATCGGAAPGSEGDFELLETLEEEIRRELLCRDRDDEQSIADAYAESEAALMTGAAPPSQVAPLCPLCKASKLMQAGTVISCPACLSRLDVADGSVGLPFLSEQLQSSLSAHSATPCSADPVFSIESRFGPQTLVMSCPACGNYTVII